MRKHTLGQKLLAMLLSIAMLLTYLPSAPIGASATQGNGITTVADPETLTRPEVIYGDDTRNAGKVTVGKSVSTEGITVNGQQIALDGEDNFLITISQSAQVMGLSTETNVPVDVVFVLDTSGSMASNGRAEALVTAANSAIKTLMETHEQNRVAVVAFSSEGYGGGSSNDSAANVLSTLAHYSGNAATNHLQWVTGDGSTTGNDREYIAGRNTVVGNNGRTSLARRHGKNGGTNIQMGIVEGAKILTSVTDTTYTDPKSGQTITRIPFLIVISDGQPTFTYDDATWYDPSLTGDDAASEQGPGSDAYEGNGFIAAMTAAYYKGKITEHYYGDTAGGDNHCYVYTMGVEMEALSGAEKALAEITLDPADKTTGTYAEDNAASYWNYGNTFASNTKDSTFGWKTYWNNYLTGNDFTVRVDAPQDVMVWVGEGEEGSGAPQRSDYWSNQAYREAYQRWYNQNYEQRQVETNYTFTAAGIAASKAYVNAYGGIAYNDEYFAADDVADMESIFSKLLSTIQAKAISVPTKVTTGDHDFDGYVHFYDPIGAYMEVKDMKGVVADGYFYQGASFAQKLKNYGTTNADAEFDALIHKVIKTRMELSSTHGRFDSEAELDAFIHDLLVAARSSENQANYVSSTNYDNSIVWWGNAYDSGEEDEHVQLIGFADNDTIDYIEDQKAQNGIPADADYVCRSYFFYGEAGGANTNPDHEYLYFMVRVQRELEAPYRETVIISAPASLLSMEKVLITESFDDDGNAVYTATVEEKQPARVVYEVGLRSDITAENVAYIVSEDYANQAVNGGGSVNYDAATDTYHFFTNEWDRSETLGSHHRAQAKATFDAAADNAFYTYQEDTLIVDANGNAVTSDPKGTTAYYIRTYYDWADANETASPFTAVKKTQLIEIEIPADAQLLEKDGKWYLQKGAYTAATLVVNGDDTEKSENKTGTSSIVAHPHRTGAHDNSHYTVLLGNNGKLSLKADHFIPVKTASINLEEAATEIVDDNGKPVKIGDVLTYTIQVKNVMSETADITVTDYIPQGTAFIAGSAGSGTAATGHTPDATIVPDSNNVLTWVLEAVPAGETRYVSFRVEVTKAAMSLNVVPGSISNTAKMQIANLTAVESNPTYNPPYGKQATDLNHNDATSAHGYKVGDTLVYHIRFHNTAVDAQGEPVAANVTITDKIPEGTTFLSADQGGTYDAATGTVTWNFTNWEADTAGVVSVQVQINASVKVQQNAPAGTEPADGEIYLANTATIQLGNDPQITLTTNTTENWADVGDMAISKLVAEGGDRSKVFTIDLTESTGMLNGRYAVTGGNADSVVFADGKASLSIAHGQTLTIQGLPAGVIITVQEDVSALPGWTPTYNTQSVTVVKGAATQVSSVSVTNTYTLQPLTLTLVGKKVMEGILPTATTFGFVAEPDSSNPVVGEVLTGEVTAKNAGEYAIAFSTKTFTVPGVYKYTISEVGGGVKGVTYDDTKHQLVITVTDNGDGTMRAAATLNGNAFVMGQDAVTFTNTYTPDDVPLNLVAKKNLKVYDPTTDSYIDGTLSTGAYRFAIVPEGSEDVIAIGSNAADGTVTFNTFYFGAELLKDVVANGNGDKVKDFVLEIREVIPELGGDDNTLYDASVKKITAQLKLDANGILSVSVNGDSDGTVDLTESVVFTNYRNPASVQITPKGAKTTADAPAGITFSFAVTNTQSGNEASVGVGAANGSISFAPMTYTQEGAYTYWIKEANAGNTTNGITYDAARYLMKVVVSRNAYNRLVAEVTYWSSATVGSANVADYTIPASQPAFHNVYEAGGYINLTATKILEKRDLVAGEFAFKLIRQDNGGEIDGLCDANGKIIFSTMYYSSADIPAGETSAVIHYVMSEVIPTNAKLPGVSYDDSKHDVYVRITDDGAGHISAELVAPDGNGGYTAKTGTDTGVTFTNRYAPVHGDAIKLRISKTLAGRDLRDGEFEFAIYHDGYVMDYATNDTAGNVEFVHELSATAVPGTYELIIKESKGSLGSVSYDGSSYSVFIQIEDDKKGSIVATLVDADGKALPVGNDGFVDLSETINFQNTYVPSEALVQIEATKQLTGRPLVDKEFNFVVRENNAAGAVVATGTNDANGKILFSTFDISHADMTGATESGGKLVKTFTYVVMESNNNHPGIKIDDTRFTVTVTVTDDGNGALSAVVNYPDNQPIVFQNTYTPAAVELPLVAFKQLTGKTLKNGEFTFLLKDSDGETLQTKTNDASGVITFENLKFGKAGTYTFTVNEVDPQVDGMVFDRNEFTITVKVTDDLGGKLVAEASYTDKDGAVELIQFVNTYTPPAIDVKLEGTKVITDPSGNKLSFSAAGFAFEVYDMTGTKVADAVSNDAGEIEINGLHFRTAGEHRFLIKEVAGNKPGYTYDPTVWCVHITIGYDALEGILSNTGNFIHVAPESHEIAAQAASQELTFTNVYDAEDVELYLTVKKQLEGRPLREHEFTFYVVDKDSGLTVAQARNQANGNVTFHIPYSKADTYEYAIYEEHGSAGGVTYTDKRYDLSVTVTDEGSGKLTAKVAGVTYTGTANVDLTGSVIFKNVYDPDAAEATVQAVKQLQGKALGDLKFNFKLTDAADPSKVYTAQNDANGLVTFEKLSFAAAGTYTYYLTEEAGSLGGITYDTAKYSVVIQVTDDGNGKLSAEQPQYLLENAAVDHAIFRNVYTVTGTAQTDIPGTKVLDGKPMVPGEFIFQLYDAEGKFVMETTNAQGGDFLFEDVVLNTLGDNHFTVVEKDTGVEGMTYDDKVYDVVITVSDNGVGGMEVTAVKTSLGGVVVPIVFGNSYDPADITVVLNIQKIVQSLSESTISPEGFKFRLSDETGAEVATTTSDEEGVAQFRLGFSEQQIGRIIRLTISEVDTHKSGVVYSEETYDVEIAISQQMDGKLSATVKLDTVQVEQVNVTFTNQYKKPTNHVTGDNFQMLTFFGMMVLSSFGLAAVVVCKKRSEMAENEQ